MNLSGTALIVQMRLDSSRLPEKALLRIGGTTLAGLVMRRLKNIPADCYILASDADGARALAASACDEGFEVFAGSKEDVLGRFAMAIREYKPEKVIRATGDNPFVSVRLAEEAYALSSEADYVGILGMPVGMGVEVVRAEALLDAARLADDVYDREHVCPFLYKNPSMFVIRRPQCPPEYRMSAARVTVDTAADFDRAAAIVAALGSMPSDEALLAWLRGSEVKSA